MLNFRIKRQAAQAAQATARMAEIEASVVALGDEDLLDLADIFANAGFSPLKEMASIEMAKRKISL